MKKLIILSALALCIGVSAQAQRNLPAQKAIQISGGTVDGLWLRKQHDAYSYFGSIALTHTNRNQTYWLYSLGYQQKDYLYNEVAIPKVQFAGEIGYYAPLLSDRGRNVRLLLGVSALAGYETSN